jgi:hypothetical protein
MGKPIKLKELIFENSTSTYDYGCVMLNLQFPKIEKLHNLISPNDIYIEAGDNSYGLEDIPHITLLYGLHDTVSVVDVERVIAKHTYGDCILWNPSLFQSDNYDVLKYDVRYPFRGGAFLHKTNSDLKKYPHTSTFPNYHPHLTVCYLKKGMGQKYVDIIKNHNFDEFTLKPEYITYSAPNGMGEYYIQININEK